MVLLEPIALFGCQNAFFFSKFENNKGLACAFVLSSKAEKWSKGSRPWSRHTADGTV
jgi:hypothetical protein